MSEYIRFISYKYRTPKIFSKSALYLHPRGLSLQLRKAQFKSTHVFRSRATVSHSFVILALSVVAVVALPADALSDTCGVPEGLPPAPVVASSALVALGLVADREPVGLVLLLISRPLSAPPAVQLASGQVPETSKSKKQSR